MHALAFERTRFSEVEEEIQRLETHLAALRIERREIRRRLDEYTYPVLTLPNEVTTEIFVQYLPSHPRCPPLVGLGSPTHLLGICRPWRHIALHSPELWRAIELNCEYHPKRIGVAQAWLQRSRSTLLSLRLDFLTIGPSEDSLLRAVVAHRSRWEYIDLLGPPHLISLISGPSPRLRGVALSTPEDEVVDIISLQNAHLRFVSLWGVGYNTSSLSWDQLTSLSLRDTTFVECAPILEMARNLLRCKLFVRGPRPAEGIQVQIPRLEVLSLHMDNDDDDDDEDDLEKTVDAFILPSLRKLEIGDTLLGVHAVERLKSFISRSKCRLERLHLVSSQFTTDGPVVHKFRMAFPLVAVDAISYRGLYDNLNWEVDTEKYLDLVTKA
ncbi:hypothetical protein C8F01DRAFT_3809 [Mycena amicta]|nr:hypothetical protein C8F01DRAFT_3809 [Mycena amicta]